LPTAQANSEERPIAGWQYDYDALGRMGARKDSVLNVSTGFGYDRLGRLVAAQPLQDAASPQAPAAAAALEYYAYDALGTTLGRRVAGDDQDFRNLAIERSAGGLPQRIGNRTLAYSADRRLTEVHEAGRPLARYRHNAYGERIGKSDLARETEFLYFRQQLVAETMPNRPDLLARRYVYAHGVPVAVIDYPQGQALRAESDWTNGSMTRAVSLAYALIDTVTGRAPRVAYVHANEIGTPVAVTDAAQKVVWRAQYRVYGEANVVNAVASPISPRVTYALNLRLPGQYWDAETGWHDNYLRTYDPMRGQYLEPDPLGPVGGSSGTQPFSYVNHNPLIYADPLGLILFAFDGTRQTAEGQTNVWHFLNHYDGNDDLDEQILGSERGYYMPGPGSGWDYWLDAGIAYSLRGRIDDQLARLDRHVRQKFQLESARRSITRDDPMVLTVDVVGFSRGATAARDFANQVISRRDAGYYRNLAGVDGGCVRIEFRFMGLFDTVRATTLHSFNLNIPTAVGYAAHAVAVNEHRHLFPVESIEESFADIGFSSNRIERGFVGAHSDIGGGYTNIDGGDLSDVALNWMVRQAQHAGVQMLALGAELRTVSNPIVHDERRTLGWRLLGSDPPTGDRVVRYPMASDAPNPLPHQAEAPIAGLNTAEAEQFIVDRNDFIFDIRAAQVDMVRYAQWLRSNYGIYLNH
jgi:RHS repeat-associated protein